MPLTRDPATGQPVVPHTFRPLTIRGVTLKNRIGVSPMCMYSCEDGHMSDFHVMHLGKFASAGAGLIIAEMTNVQAHGRISPYCSGLWKDSQIAPLKRVADFVHAMGGPGTAFGVQIAHAGRKASQLPPFLETPESGMNALAGAQKGWPNDVVAPSAIAWDDGWIQPKQLSLADINDLVKDFAAAAVRADKAGVDIVELHGAHGYLIHQFLSPLSNTRTDAYGGTFENRIRFPTEVVRAVRSVWPAHKPLFLRLSCTDWVEGSGWDVPQAVQFVQRLHEQKLGVDLVDASSGGNSGKQKITTGPCYQVPFSTALRNGVTGGTGPLLTSTVGEVRTAAQVEQILSQKQADVVLIGRQFLRDPHFVLRAAKELAVPVSWAPQYGYGRFGF